MPGPLVIMDLADGSWLNDIWEPSGVTPPIVGDPDPNFAGRNVIRAFLDFDLNMNGGTAGGQHQYRTEITPAAGHAYKNFVFGDRNLIGMRMYIPTSFVTRDGNGELIAQFHADQAHTIGWGNRGGPTIAIRTYGANGTDGKLELSIVGDATQDSTASSPTRKSQRADLKKPDGTAYTLADLADKWVTLIFDIKWSFNDDGRTILYIDPGTGLAIAADITNPNGYNDPLGPFIKLGDYKPSWNFSMDKETDGWKGTYFGVRTRLHYFADITIGDVASGHTLEDVTPPGPNEAEPPPSGGDDPGANPGSLLFHSTFTAPNGTAITAVAPVTDVIGGGFLGDASIQSNALAFTANGQYAAANVGSRNQRLRVTWTANDDDNRSQIVLRASQGDASLPATGYTITLRTDLNNIQLGEITANTNNLLASTDYMMDIGATYEVIAEVWNDRIQVWMDNGGVITQVLNLVSTLHVEGNFFQLRHVTYASTGGRFDALSVYGESSASVTPPIKVQRIQGVIEQNLASGSLTEGFTPVADVNKALLRISGFNGMAMGKSDGTTSGQAIRQVLIRPGWNGPGQIDLVRHELGTSDTACELEIVESLVDTADGFTVLDRGTITLGHAVLTNQTATIAGVTDATKVWVRITGCTYDGLGNSPRSVLCTAEFTGGKATFTRLTAANAVTLSYEVVQLGANWTVQVVSHAFSAANTVETATITAVNWAQTLPFMTVRCSDAGDDDSEVHCWPGASGTALKLFSPASANVEARVWLISHASLNARHANSIDGSEADLPVASGLQTVTRSLAMAVVPERTLAAATLGNRDASTRNPGPNWQWRALGNGTQIQFQRSRGDAISALAYTVADMDEVGGDPPPVNVPTPPGSPYVIILGDTTATLGWGASHSDVGLQEYGYDIDGGAITWTGNTALAVGLSGLTLYTEYVARIHARDTNLDPSDPSSSVFFRTLDSTQPLAPATPSATGVTTGTVRITANTLATPPPSGVAFYLVEVDGVLREDEIGGFPYDVSGFDPASEHDFVLYTVSGDGVLSDPSVQFIGATLALAETISSSARSRPIRFLPRRVERIKVRRIGSRASKATLALFSPGADGSLTAQPVRGAGATTFTRSSTALALDYAGVYHEVSADVARWHGALIDGDVFYAELGDGTPLHPTVVEDGATLFAQYDARANSTAYVLGERLIPASGSGPAGGNGYWYEVTVAGTTGAAPPTFPTTIDATIADGTATLRCGGYYRIDGIVIEPTRTNVALHSRDATQAAWTKVTGVAVARDQAGIDGAANTACTVTDANTGGLSRIDQVMTVPNDAATHCTSIFVLADNDETRFPEIGLVLFGGTTVTNNVQINTKTGANTTRASSGTSTYQVARHGAWWKITQTITNNTSGNTSLAVRVYPAINSTLGGTGVTAVGSVVIDQVDIRLNSAVMDSPIPTAGSAVTRDADTLTIPKANIDDTSGTLLADYRPANWAAPAGYIVGEAAGYVLAPLATNNGAKAYDGTNTALGPGPAAVQNWTLAQRPSYTPTGVVLSPGDDIQAFVDANPVGTVFDLTPGVYRMQQVAPKAGNQFIGQDGAIMNGSAILTGWVVDGANWKVTGQTQAGEINGACEVGFERCDRPEDLYFDDVPLVHATSLAALDTGKWFFDYDTDTIYVRDDPTAGAVVETSITRHAFTNAADNVVIEGLTIEKYACPAQFGAINGDTTSGWTVRYNTVQLNHGTGIRIGDNWLVAHNLVYNNGQMGIAGIGDNTQIIGNEISTNNYAMFSRLWESGGTKFVQTNGLLVRGNYVHDNGGPGLWTDIDNVATTYEHNLVTDNTDVGIYHEISYAVVIRYNTVMGNGKVQDDWLWGSQILISTSQDGEVHDNYVNVDADGGNGLGLIQQDRGSGIYGVHKTINNYVHHNIIVYNADHAGISGGVEDFDNAGFIGGNNRFDYNTWYSPNPDLFMWYWIQVKTWADFQAEGHEANGTEIIGLPPSPLPSGMIQAAATWNSSTLRVRVDGIAGYPISYDGSFELADNVPIGSGYHGRIRNLRVLKS